MGVNGTKNLAGGHMDKKTAYLFCKFLQVEMKKIDEDKYFQGIRIQCDPGQEYIVDWINRNAKKWREEWESSCCQHCQHWLECGHQVKKDCVNFGFDEKESEYDS